MFALQKSKSKTSSRNQIAIKGVRDGILMLPNNEYRAILQVSSLNFELRSEEEQDAIMDTYESFLNSVGSSLQILIRTREIVSTSPFSEHHLSEPWRFSQRLRIGLWRHAECRVNAACVVVRDGVSDANVQFVNSAILSERP